MSNWDNNSSRIEMLRFPLIVGVVFIHQYSTTLHLVQAPIGGPQCSDWVDFIKLFISRGVADTAVPMFFLISGYLFSLGDWSLSHYLGKLKRRINTLLIPYLFWNIGTIALAEGIPRMKVLFGHRGGQAPSHSFTDYVALAGITTKYPLAYQFWFIRDLMALVLLVPVIHFLLSRKSAIPFLIALSCLWFFGVWPILWPRAEAVFFFSLGSYFSKPGKTLALLDKLCPWTSTLFLIGLILNSVTSDRLPYLHRSMVLLGVPTVWWLAGLAARTDILGSLLQRLSDDSFFVFAAHEPLLTTINNFAFKLLSPTGGGEILALYISIPLGLIAFLVTAHRFLERTVPSFAGIITGNSHRSNLRTANHKFSDSDVRLKT